MPVPNPRTWTVNETATAALMNQEVRDPLSFLLDAPRTKVTLSTAQSIPHATATLIEWDEEIFESGVTHSNFSNSERLTIVDPGRYLVVANVTFEPSEGGGQRRLDLCFNGNVTTTRPFVSENMDPISSASIASSLSTSGQFRADTGDYFMTRVYQSSTFTKGVLVGSSMTVVWIGR